MAIALSESEFPSTVQQRAADLHERSRLGGIFYVLSWLLVAGFSDGWSRYPAAGAVLAAVFAVLMVARFVIRTRFLRDPATAAPSIRQQWTVLLLTGLFWGATSGWALVDPAFAAARPITLIATSSLAMAYAQIFAVDKRLSLLGTATVYLPMLLSVWIADELGLGMVLMLNGVYLVAVIGRSHREYEGKLALDEELRTQRDRFATQSRTDALTGLGNRGHFQQSLDAGVGAARDHGTPLALLIADLDHFKTVNDRFGHAAGDRCLRDVARLMQETWPGPGVLVARLGGEEFGALLAGEAAVDVLLVAEVFRARVGRLQVPLPDGGSFAITVSVGIATFSPTAHTDSDALYAAADTALYRAKHAGRDRLVAA